MSPQITQMVQAEIERNKRQVKCALYLLLCSGLLATTIGIAVLFIAPETDSTLGLRAVGGLFLAAGLFGLITGVTVKFGSKQAPSKRPNSPSVSPYYTHDMFIRVNGGISRVSARPYAPCYYYVANEIQAQSQRSRRSNRTNQEIVVHDLPSFVHDLPQYSDVVRDTKGKNFKFVDPPSYKESC